MGFSIETSVSAVTVFLQGALSFFSPCVLPLVPLYVSYLAGGAAVVGDDGKASIAQDKCVGCGRCLKKCPNSLNIVKVAKTLGGTQA